MKRDMKEYDFDRFVDRSNTNDLKWRPENMLTYGFYANNETIPMWLADTDFPCAPFIVNALRERLEKEIYGYCAPTDRFYQAIRYWMREGFDWDVDKSWILTSPSVVAGINAAIRCFSSSGDGVIVQTPVYDPFFKIINGCGRTVRNNQLLCRDGRYEIDYEGLEKIAADPDVTMMLLCSPHNPVGRVWKKDELIRVEEICLANDLILVTDEIHSDIIYSGNTHFPLLSLDDRYKKNVIYLNAPGKSFNIAGLKMSYAIIPDEDLKKRFSDSMTALSLDIRNTFGIEGVEAAYSPAGREWLKQEVAYLEKNRDFVQTFVSENFQGKVKMNSPEGSFLCWIDISGLGLTDEQVMGKIGKEANVFCIPGNHYGAGGEGYFRFNTGSQRKVVETALLRIKKVLMN